VKAPELLVVAGEASGDLHGARLIAELRQRVPGLTTFGLGGDEMRAAGLEAVAHSSEISVVGITEVLKVLPRAREIFAGLLREVDRRRPALAVLVDFPDFNLRLAKELKTRNVEVVYYISPQVWAWRRGRVKKIARLVDRMLVLFPFEVDFYRGHGIQVVHVGHPLVDEVPVLPQGWDRGEPAGEPYRVALLPGSRTSEVEALLPPCSRRCGSWPPCCPSSLPSSRRRPSRGTSWRSTSHSPDCPCGSSPRTASRPSPIPTWPSAPRARRRSRWGCSARP